MFKTGAVSSTLKGMVHSSDVIFTGRVPSSELQKILAGALALTFVPFFEGFGIPVAEAMAAGVPVICSGTTSLPRSGEMLHSMSIRKTQLRLPERCNG
jgi:glycosyltransferase involved in cell wall biosynthesis